MAPRGVDGRMQRPCQWSTPRFHAAHDAHRRFWPPSQDGRRPTLSSGVGVLAPHIEGPKESTAMLAGNAGIQQAPLPRARISRLELRVHHGRIWSKPNPSFLFGSPKLARALHLLHRWGRIWLSLDPLCHLVRIVPAL
jgi:hypothetical protein